MAIALGILALTFMGFAGYTMALQWVFHVLMEHGPARDAVTARREAAVMLRIYIGKLNLAFALGMVAYFIASRHADSQLGVLLVVLCTVGGRLFAGTWLQPDTPHMMAGLAAALERQRRFYHWLGKATQEQTVRGLLVRLDMLRRDLERQRHGSR
jgi:hypothetical protein